MSGLKFTKSHEWVKIDNDTAVIGITDYAQQQLGDIVFIELPAAGGSIKKTLQFGTIESTKAASEIYAPLSGKVVEVNNDLVNNPQWINKFPFQQGWMIKIKIKDANEINDLLDEAAYKAFIEKERH